MLGVWGQEPQSPNGGGEMMYKLQEDAELAQAQLSQATMEMENMREELEASRHASSEKVARLQKEVDLAKHATDGELAGIISVT